MYESDSAKHQRNMQQADILVKASTSDLVEPDHYYYNTNITDTDPIYNPL